ncbi:MAG TPA: DUF3429 domain-containing protein [Sphingomonas sp.]|nr:DUF3429 domain-containing protein [Sphingomonas sp.]
MTDAAVGGTARLLGFAGLLPPVAAIVMIALGWYPAAAILFIYPLLILSFLGGAWWGFAMMAGVDQPRLAVVAVMPSLIALALQLGFYLVPRPGWLLVVTGTALMLTLLVDRGLTRRGLTPVGWMALRIPLSLGLGALTILGAVVIETYVPYG